MSTTATLTIRDRLLRIVSDHLGVEPEKVVDEAHLMHDLGADSLDAIEIAMELEEQFRIEITDDDLEQVSTFGDLVGLVERTTGAA